MTTGIGDHRWKLLFTQKRVHRYGDPTDRVEFWHNGELVAIVYPTSHPLGVQIASEMLDFAHASLATRRDGGDGLDIFVARLTPTAKVGGTGAQTPWVAFDLLPEAERP